MKKNFRIFVSFLLFWILKIISKIFIKSKIKILPPLEIKKVLNLIFSQKTRRLVFRKDEESFGKIIF